MDRKKKLKILTVFPIISELIALFFLPSEVPDGPTTIFLAGSLGSGIPLLLIIGFIIGIVVLKLKKR